MYLEQSKPNCIIQFHEIKNMAKMFTSTQRPGAALGGCYHFWPSDRKEKERSFPGRLHNDNFGLDDQK